MAVSRREVLGLALATALGVRTAHAGPDRASRRVLIVAPTNLGLRPGPGGAPPGTWKMPETLLEDGLARAIGADRVELVRRIAYLEGAQAGTRIRNGNSIRRFSLALARKVSATLSAGEFPIVLGGDCSVLLGSLLGARRQGGRGLIHVDGHSDFFHPGNYDTSTRLGTAAGMDLALVTGRGESLLTDWPGIAGPLVADDDAIQIGERESEDPDYETDGYGDIEKTEITRITIQSLQKAGIGTTAAKVLARMEQRALSRAWLHIDFDVLDQAVLPAVDSPGSPGLSSGELSELLGILLRSQRVVGMDFAIYDPDLDPNRRYSRMLVDCIARSLGRSGIHAATE